jgi:hypothetical protein
MGLSLTIRSLLVRLSVFAGWTLSRFAVPRFVRWVNLLGGVDILSLLFHRISKLWISAGIDAATNSVPAVVCAHTSCTAAIAHKFVGRSVSRSRRSHAGSQDESLTCRDQPLKFKTYLHGRIPIHSPPIAS